jgi:hypothetical protein
MGMFTEASFCGKPRWISIHPDLPHNLNPNPKSPYLSAIFQSIIIQIIGSTFALL